MDTTDQIITKFGTYIVDPLLLVIFAAGFFLFMWGLFEFMVKFKFTPPTKSVGHHHCRVRNVGGI